MDRSSLKIPKTKPRNPLVAPTKTRSGAGKHKNKKKEEKFKGKELYD